MYATQENGQQSIVSETGSPHYKVERGIETITTTSGTEDPTGQLKNSGAFIKPAPGESIISCTLVNNEYVVSGFGVEEHKGETGKDMIFTTIGTDDVEGELRRSKDYVTTSTGTPYSNT